jgi:hypothetical protein
MTRPVPLSASAISIALAALLASACGGASAPAASAASASAASSLDGGASAAAAAPSSAPSSPTTTTATLPDAGELQGAKLQSSSTSGVQTADMPEAGPGRGPHQSEPGRSVKDIQVIVQAHRDEARACYDRVQQDHPDPNLKGNLDVKWTIDPTGKVTEIAIDDSRSDIHDTLIGKCVMTIIKGIKFSVSAKGFETRAHYPFNFNPHNVTPPRPQAN